MFLLIERDPFVRTDMCLTLTEAFPAVEVVSVDSIVAGQAATLEKPGLLRPRLVIYDGAATDPTAQVQFDIWRRDQTPVLLTNVKGADAEAATGTDNTPGANANGGTETRDPPSLSRPFTTEMLLRAVQAAMRTMA